MVRIARSGYYFRMLFFLMYKQKWYFNDKRTSVCYSMYLHFSNFPHHINEFDYLIHLIPELLKSFSRRVWHL